MVFPTHKKSISQQQIFVIDGLHHLLGFLAGIPVKVEITSVERTLNHKLNPFLYTIHVFHGDNYHWVLRRRYHHFRKLHTSLVMFKRFGKAGNAAGTGNAPGNVTQDFGTPASNRRRHSRENGAPSPKVRKGKKNDRQKTIWKVNDLDLMGYLALSRRNLILAV